MTKDTRTGEHRGGLSSFEYSQCLRIRPDNDVQGVVPLRLIGGGNLGNGRNTATVS